MYIIDRFESAWVVVEDEQRETFHLPRSLVPAQAQEGDVVTINVTIDAKATAKLRAALNEMTRGIFKD